MHRPERLGAYVPGGHTTAVALVEPEGHAYPARQLPEQLLFVRADVAPKVPAGQGAQWLAPAALDVPAGHAYRVGVVDPVPLHMYPAEQGRHAPAPPSL
jgi:hypothetical protein